MLEFNATVVVPIVLIMGKKESWGKNIQQRVFASGHPPNY